MKRLFISLFCAVLITPLGRADELVTDAESLKRDLVGTWGRKELEIVDDDGLLKFTAFDISEGGIEAEGVCTIEGETIRFTIGFRISGRDDGLKKKWHDRIAKLYISDERISSYLVLKFSDKGGFWKRLVQPPGLERTYKGIPVVITNRRGYTNDNVRIRTGPSTEYEPVSFWNFDDPHAKYNTEYPYVPRWRIVFVRARTKEKMQIGDWNNYWYLIDVPAVHNFHFGTSYAQHWAYAEFIDFPPGQYRKKPVNQLTDSYLRSVGSWHGQSSLDFFEESGSTYFRRYDTHVFTGEISIHDEGEYEISNGELLYRSEKFPQKLPSQLQMTDHHVEYTELLTFDGRSFYNTASLVPEGSQRVYEGIPISTLRKRGHITREARSWIIPAPDAQEQDPLSDGTKLMIVGKTRQTMEVHGMSMHFFLVRHLNSEAYHRWVAEDYIEFE
ncbi:MAG TPA: hypothetical protein ENI27_06185 [bacterium]|nr:hypothetical protein [bacterium]